MDKPINRIHNIYCATCEDEECLDCNAIGIAKNIENEIRADERAKIIKTIIESANHLGYEDIEDLIAYAQEKLFK